MGEVFDDRSVPGTVIHLLHDGRGSNGRQVERWPIKFRRKKIPWQPLRKLPPNRRAKRFNADMPQIPGVIAGGPSRKQPSVNPAIPLGIGIAAVVLVALLGARLVSHPKPVEPVVAAPPPQIEVAAPAVDPNSLLPHATGGAPEIATVAEMSKPGPARASSSSIT